MPAKPSNSNNNIVGATRKSVAETDFVEILRKRKQELEDKLQEQVSMSRLATYLMEQQTTDEEQDASNHQVVDQIKKKKTRVVINTTTKETHQVRVVSEMSDISCSEWELEEEEEDDRSGLQASECTDVSRLQSIEASLHTEPKLNNDHPYHQRDHHQPEPKCRDSEHAAIQQRGTPTTSSSQSSLSGDDDDKDIERGNAGDREVHVIIHNNNNNVDVMKKPTFMHTDSTTTLTADGDSNTDGFRLKRPFLSVVVCLSVIVAILVVTVLVLTIMTFCGPKNNNHDAVTFAPVSSSPTLSPGVNHTKLSELLSPTP